jgi:hypothetical protein
VATQTRSYAAARNKGPVQRAIPSAQKRNETKAAVPSRSGSATRTAPPPSANGKPEPKIIFQKFFRSVGPRTYASQVKELANGNHLLVLTEGKRDEATGEVRKTRLFIYGEDFTAFFRLLHETAAFIRANPLPEEVRERRNRFWAKKAKESRSERSSGWMTAYLDLDKIEPQILEEPKELFATDENQMHVHCWNPCFIVRNPLPNPRSNGSGERRSNTQGFQQSKMHR